MRKVNNEQRTTVAGSTVDGATVTGAATTGSTIDGAATGAVITGTDATALAGRTSAATTDATTTVRLSTAGRTEFPGGCIHKIIWVSLKKTDTSLGSFVALHLNDNTRNGIWCFPDYLAADRAGTRVRYGKRLPVRLPWSGHKRDAVV